MPVTDEVARLVRIARDRTVERTNQQVVTLTREWTAAWDELAPELAAAVTDIVNSADGTIPASVISKNRRLAQALARAQDALDTLGDSAAVVVVNDLAETVIEAVDAHLASLQAQLPPDAPGVVLGRLDDDALETIVARSTQRIHALSLDLAPATVTAMKAELVRGITVGSNPNVVARRIMTRTEGAFNGGLARATRIARTEMLTAHRTADHAAAKANASLIKARVWTATLDSRTCPSCLAQHGTEWPVDAYGPADHVQGRCVFIDKTKSWAELGFTGIEDDDLDLQAERDEWWLNLTTTSQDATLGKARADLLRSGQVQWSDLTTLKRNDQWMDHYVQTPLKDLLPQQ